MTTERDGVTHFYGDGCEGDPHGSAPEPAPQGDVAQRIHDEHCRGYQCTGYRCEVKAAAESALAAARSAAFAEAAAMVRPTLALLLRTVNVNWQGIDGRHADRELGEADGLETMRSAYEDTVIDAAMALQYPPDWDSLDQHDDWKRIEEVTAVHTRQMFTVKLDWAMAQVAASLERMGAAPAAGAGSGERAQ